MDPSGMLVVILGALTLTASCSQGTVLSSCEFDDGTCGWTPGAGDFMWTRHVYGAARPRFTGPSQDVSETGKGGYMFVESSLPQRENHLCRLQSPILTVPEATPLDSFICISFHLHMFGEGTGSVKLNILPVPGVPANIFARHGDHENGWSEVKLRMDIPRQPFRAEIMGIVGRDDFGDAAVDKLEIKTCDSTATDYKLVSASAPLVEYPPPIRSGALPFRCTFETDRCGFTQAQDDQFEWWRRAGVTTTFYTGPPAGHTTGNKADGYILADASTPRSPGDTGSLSARLVSPLFATDASKRLCVQFYYYMWGAGMGTFKVASRSWTCPTEGACVSGPATVFMTKTGDQTDAWILHQQKLTVQAFTTIEFESISWTFLSDMAVDDVDFSICEIDHVLTPPVVAPLPYPDGCAAPTGITVTDASGYIASDPIYPESFYKSNLACRWVINRPADPTKALEISFDANFNIEPSEQCSIDFVRIYDGLTDADLNLFSPCSSPSLFPNKGPYCGTYAPAKYISQTNRVVIEFCTDGRNKRAGFRADWKETDMIAVVPPTPICSRNFAVTETGEAVLFKLPESLSTSATYENNWNCQIKFTNPNPGHVILINTASFDVPEQRPGACIFDYLEILEKGATTGDRFCGSVGPVQYRSSSDEVTVKFVTDSSDVGGGFRIAAYGTRCSKDMFQCGTGPTATCIPETQVCDGVNHCPTTAPGEIGADELSAVCKYRYQCGIKGTIPRFPPELNFPQTETHPWHVPILSRSRRLACSGTLIARTWILTTAQCVDRFFRNGEVILDDMILLLDTPTTDFRVWPKLSEVVAVRIVKHPDFSPGSLRSDIALINFRPPTGLSSYRIPVCFSGADDSYLKEGSDVTLASFDHIKKTVPIGARSDEPDRQTTTFSHVTPLKMKSRVSCNNVTENTIDQNMLCSETYACETEGDLGAPLVVNHDGVHHLVGIYSHSASECRSSYNPRLTPAIYTRLKSYADWIKYTLAV